jgi:hypothetical protein
MRHDAGLLFLSLEKLAFEMLAAGKMRLRPPQSQTHLP